MPVILNWIPDAKKTFFVQTPWLALIVREKYKEPIPSQQTKQVLGLEVNGREYLKRDPRHSSLNKYWLVMRADLSRITTNAEHRRVNYGCVTIKRRCVQSNSLGGENSQPVKKIAIEREPARCPIISRQVLSFYRWRKRWLICHLSFYSHGKNRFVTATK